MANLLLLTSVLHALVIRFEVQGIECTEPYQLRTTSSNYGDLTAWLGVGDYAGYLEICGPIDQGQWTPMCGEHWTDREALAACNILGYSNTTTIAITGGTCLAPPGNITTTSVEILQCSGTERSLEDCRQSSVVPRCSQWGGVICTSMEACSEEICSNSSYCHSSSTCFNCSIPQELDCTCYGECSEPCLNGGKCTYNNTCECLSDWTGERCEKELLPDTTSEPTDKSCLFDCLNGGTCINGSCECTINYEGLQCEIQKGGGGGGSFILYIIISLLIIFLIIGIGAIVLIIVIILARKNKQKQKIQTGSFEDEKDYIQMDKVTDNVSYHTNRNIVQTEDDGEIGNIQDIHDENGPTEIGDPFGSKDVDDDCYSTISDLDKPSHKKPRMWSSCGNIIPPENLEPSINEYYSISNENVSVHVQGKKKRICIESAYYNLAESSMDVYDDILGSAEYTEIPSHDVPRLKRGTRPKHRSQDMEEVEDLAYVNQLEVVSYYNGASREVMSVKNSVPEVSRTSKQKCFDHRKTNVKDNFPNSACSRDAINEPVYNNY